MSLKVPTRRVDVLRAMSLRPPPSYSAVVASLDPIRCRSAGDSDTGNGPEQAHRVEISVEAGAEEHAATRRGAQRGPAFPWPLSRSRITTSPLTEG